ncbi:MAG: hypothetical protein AB7P18_22165 [Candidatus Binatia bacterium]
MSLTPTASVTLGNFRYDTHVAAVVASLAGLPRGNTFTVRLPETAPVEAAANDDAILVLDGGEGLETVVTGKLRTFHRHLSATTVSAADGGADLSSFRPAVTYERQSAKDIIRALANEVQVRIGRLDLDLSLAAYVADPARTAAEHIAALARLGGAVASLDGQGHLQVTMRPGPQAQTALRYGREILTYTVREHPGAPVRYVSVGNGPSSSAEAPNALRHTSAVIPTDAPAAGRSVVRQVVPILRTPRAALVASQAQEKAQAAAIRRLSAGCFLLPRLRPGMVIEVQDLPERLPSGSWLITRVEHRLTPGQGGHTTVEAESAATTGLGGVLQGALAAVGGLL